MTKSNKLPPFWRSSPLPPLGWKTPKQKLDSHPGGLILFDYTFSSQSYTFESVLAHQHDDELRRGSKNEGTINCVYIKPSNETCRIVDYRKHGGRSGTKNVRHHVQDMLADLVEKDAVPFATVIMKSWYATESIMLLVDRVEKTYWCPVRNNRLVKHDQDQEYGRVAGIPFDEIDFLRGKSVVLKSSPIDIPVKLFRVETTEEETAHIVTNHLVENSVQVAEVMYGVCSPTKKVHTIN